MSTNKHSIIEDVQAIIIATLLASLGVTFFKTSGLLIGGTAGLSFLGQYASQFSFSEIFFIINLPFYILAYMQLGWKFTLKTFIAVLLLSLFVAYTPLFINVDSLDPIYSAIVGGLLIGFGLLMLFRHGASLGGLMILAQFLNQKYNLSIGKFQMSVDFVVLLLAIFIVDWRAILLSILGATACNLILVINHKPGRYSGK